jgi:hypothetical protein
MVGTVVTRSSSIIRGFVNARKAANFPRVGFGATNGEVKIFLYLIFLLSQNSTVVEMTDKALLNPLNV